jgi:HTH-type transcriptional regulator / antitoxin HigA
MATSSRPGWQPGWVVAPGEILLDALQDREMNQSELAHRLGRPIKTVNEIIKGKAAITPETAIQLERALGISARFWNNLETQYRETLARQGAQADLEAQAGWVDHFPIADLVRHHLIERGPNKAATLANLLSWLGISSPAAYERVTAAAKYRASPAFAASPQAMTAWLRWGELRASSMKTAPFDARRFRYVLAEIRPMTRKAPFDAIFKQVQAMCAEAGVIVVLTPDLTGTHLSGAARWIGSKAVIQLSLRHKSDDQFWFTLFHEAGHILTGRHREDFIDGVDLTDPDTEADEQAANEFARDTLLPPDDYRRFVEVRDFTGPRVRAFAEAQSVSPGIVAGRLERDKNVNPGQLRWLKRALRYPADRQ